MAKTIVSPPAAPNQAVAPDDQDNFYFDKDQIDRAPYELGQLLAELPADIVLKSRRGLLTPQDIGVADAAREHANNYMDTLLNGIESVGAALFSAVESESFKLAEKHVRGIAALIQTLAVEAQFVRWKELDLAYVLQENKLASSGMAGGAV